MTTSDIVAPALHEGPLSGAAQALVASGIALGSTSWASVARAWTVDYVFNGVERAFESGDDPVPAVNQLLEGAASVLRETKRVGMVPGHDAARPIAHQSVTDVTASHYGELFRAFSTTDFWQEPARLLACRLERNGIDLETIRGDAGCGGGRYSAAWRQLGARAVLGVDLSAIGVADAHRRLTQYQPGGVHVCQASVLSLPVRDGQFDVVFSNGVLHHTTDWRTGIHEIVRALKPGGFGWLYLIENPGGLFWDVIEILRVLMQEEPADQSRAVLRAAGVPANRIFYMLDHVLVPINVRLTPREIEATLEEAGACGADFDRIEHIYQGAPHASVKYGVGENRYVFSRA
jgi:SAM-dependent methyltransferase